AVEKLVDHLVGEKKPQPPAAPIAAPAIVEAAEVQPLEADDSGVANITQNELRRLLEQVHELTESVRSDVGEHTDRMVKINEELESHSTEPSSVTDAIAQLIDANKSLGTRLNEAEMRLVQQSQIIQSQTAEARTDALTG